MPRIGPFGLPELLIVLVIIVLIFGVGRVGKIGEELGKGIRNFRRAVSGEDEESRKPEPPPSENQGRD